MSTFGTPRINPAIDLVVGLVPVRPIDLQLQAARRYQLAQICRVFGVPRSLAEPTSPADPQAE